MPFIPTAAQISRFPASGILGYAEIVASVDITALTDAGADVIVTGPSVAFDGATDIVVQFFAPYAKLEIDAAETEAQMTFVLFDDAVIRAEMGQVYFTGGVAANIRHYPINFVYRFRPSAAIHTYSVRGYVALGNDGGDSKVEAGPGTAGDKIPAFILYTAANG
jgi:hypothetical protein